MCNLTVYTIGVYNSTEDSFFEKLRDANIELFCDIRQRRGVRGAQYKYVNSNYLQQKLRSLNIAYKYSKDLAPTSEIRQKQKDSDALLHESKKIRTCLGDVFISEYKKQILSKFDLAAFVSEIKNGGYTNIVLFCVEEQAKACHRSIVAEALNQLYGCEIINL